MADLVPACDRNGQLYAALCKFAGQLFRRFMKSIQIPAAFDPRQKSEGS